MDSVEQAYGQYKPRGFLERPEPGLAFSMQHDRTLAAAPVRVEVLRDPNRHQAPGMCQCLLEALRPGVTCRDPCPVDEDFDGPPQGSCDVRVQEWAKGLMHPIAKG